MAVQNRITPVQQSKLELFCKAHGVKRLAFFGSVTNDQFHAGSDIDVLLEFQAGKTPGFAFFGLQEELEAILGRAVDVTTPNGLHPLIQEDILQNAQTYYEAV